MSRRTWGIVVAVSVGLAGCAQESPQGLAPVIEDKTFALTPSAATTT